MSRASRTTAAPLDERRAAQRQTLLVAGETEIVDARFAQTPNRMKHIVLSL
jgi:hypothetical protein